VGRGPEAVETESLGIASEAQRAVSDQAGAQQGSGLQIGVTLGDRKAETAVGQSILGVAAVDLVPGEPGVLAQVLAPGEAIAALAVGPPEPRHTYPLSHLEAVCVLADPLYGTDYLVARDQGQLGIGQLPVNDVQIRPAHSAAVYAQEDLPLAWLGRGHLRDPQRLAGYVQDHRSHRRILLNGLGNTPATLQ
jgi:hypothetical protein